MRGTRRHAGFSTFRSARAYFADVSRATYEAPATKTNASTANATAASPPRPVLGDRVNALYREWLRDQTGAAPEWHPINVTADLPDAWRERFGLTATHERVWARDLSDGFPVDANTLPLENGSHPLMPVRPGSLAHEFREQLKADVAASYVTRPRPASEVEPRTASRHSKATLATEEPLPASVCRWLRAEAGAGPEAPAGRALRRLGVRSLFRLRTEVTLAEARAACRGGPNALAACAAFAEAVKRLGWGGRST